MTLTRHDLHPFMTSHPNPKPELGGVVITLTQLSHAESETSSWLWLITLTPTWPWLGQRSKITAKPATYSLPLTQLTVGYLAATAVTVCSSCERWADWQHSCCCWLTATDSVYKTNVSASSVNNCWDASKLCPSWLTQVDTSYTAFSPLNYRQTHQHCQVIKQREPALFVFILVFVNKFITFVVFCQFSF